MDYRQNGFAWRSNSSREADTRTYQLSDLVPVTLLTATQNADRVWVRHNQNDLPRRLGFGRIGNEPSG